MSQIELFLDEDIWLGLASTLREQGFDVIHVNDIDRKGLSDSEQLAYATQNGRALLTHNAKDFVTLAVSYFLTNVLMPALSSAHSWKKVNSLAAL
jgi:predicted nuclease of predicted toxin-antitoxin system